jgi:peptidyl-prolyl cis-trans isomerase C
MKHLKLKLFTAASAIIIMAAPAYTSDPIVAKVNGKEIKMSEVNEARKSLPKDSPEINDTKKLVSRLVDIAVLNDAAKKSGVEKSKEVQQAVENAKEQIVMQAFIMEQLGAKVNEPAIEKEYKTLKEKFLATNKNKQEVKIRHIAFKDEASAKEAIKRLQKGEDFQKLARELSEDKQSAPDGGDLGFIPEGFIPEFDAALRDLKNGQFTQAPVKTQQGYHILKVDDRRKAQLPKFEEIKPQLAASIQQREFLELVKRLRDKASVEILVDEETKK